MSIVFVDVEDLNDIRVTEDKLHNLGLLVDTLAVDGVVGKDELIDGFTSQRVAGIQVLQLGKLSHAHRKRAEEIVVIGIQHLQLF